MAAFISSEISVATATPVKVADGDSFTRRVFTGDPTGNFRLAFTSGDSASGAFVSKLGTSASPGAFNFALPAGQELWAYQSSGSTQMLNIIVTADGEV